MNKGKKVLAKKLINQAKKQNEKIVYIDSKKEFEYLANNLRNEYEIKLKIDIPKENLIQFKIENQWALNILKERNLSEKIYWIIRKKYLTLTIKFNMNEIKKLSKCGLKSSFPIIFKKETNWNEYIQITSEMVKFKIFNNHIEVEMGRGLVNEQSNING